MSKKELDTKVSENNVAKDLNFKGKTEEELKDIKKVLLDQLQQHQIMTIKAQGALEVIDQMLKKEANIES